MTACKYCFEDFNVPSYVSKSDEWKKEFCSVKHAIRYDAEKAGKVLFEDVVTQPFIKNGNYVVDIMWEDLETSLQSYADGYKLDLDPKFQRAHVWSEDQQVAFVEYVLRGGYAGKTLYFNYPNWQSYKAEYENGKMVIVDGKQRLNSVLRFIRDEIKVFDQYLYSDFFLKRDLHHGFKFYINNLKTDKEVLQWYLDLNTRGTPHTEEELDKVRKMLDQCF